MRLIIRRSYSHSYRPMHSAYAIIVHILQFIIVSASVWCIHKAVVSSVDSVAHSRNECVVDLSISTILVLSAIEVETRIVYLRGRLP